MAELLVDGKETPEIVVEEEFKGASLLLSLEETTFLPAKNQPTPLHVEDRIYNKAQMVKSELFDYVFCGICYDLMLPEARKPVFCTLCKSAVYC